MNVIDASQAKGAETALIRWSRKTVTSTERRSLAAGSSMYIYIYFVLFFIFIFLFFYFFYNKNDKNISCGIDRATSACASAAIMVSAPHNVRCAGISIRHAQVTYIHAFTLNSPPPPPPPPPPNHPTPPHPPPPPLETFNGFGTRCAGKGWRRCFALSRQISVTHTLSQLMYYRHTTFTLYRIV